MLNYTIQRIDRATVLWKHADYHSKSLAFGYTRDIEKSHKNLKIPFDVKCVCLSYYGVPDRFTDHGDNIIVNHIGNIAEGKTKNHQRQTVYGRMVIDIKNTTYNTYRWRFRVTILHQHSPGFYIGISENISILNDSCYGHNTDHKAICFRSDGGMYPSLDNYDHRKTMGELYNKIQWKNGDIIDFELTNEIVDTWKWDKYYRRWNKWSAPMWRLFLYVNNHKAAYMNMIHAKKINRRPYMVLSAIDDLHDGKYVLACVLSEKGQGIEMLNFGRSINRSRTSADWDIETWSYEMPPDPYEKENRNRQQLFICLGFFLFLCGPMIGLFMFTVVEEMPTNMGNILNEGMFSFSGI